VSRGPLACLHGIYPLADDDPRWARDPRLLVDAALAGGATAVQLRLKRTSDRDALELASWAAARCRSHGALLFVNDRFDLADLAGAAGVHLGDTDLPPERVPEDVRARLLVGLSTHTLAQVEQSRTRPVDYVAFGPVFGTSSKQSEYAARGLEALRAAVAAARQPLVAIGGIDASNVGAVAAAGACAAAVISAFAAAPDPASAVRDLGARFAAGAPA
jgi:thiamine-phosphate pyrophosphorylase